MRKRTALVAMLLGAIAVLAIGSYRDRGQREAKNVETGPMSGYLEGAPGGPISSGANGSFEGGSKATGSTTRWSTRASRPTSHRRTSTSGSAA